MKTRLIALLLVVMLPLYASAAKYESQFIENLPELKKSSVDSDMLEWTLPSMKLASYTGLVVTQPYVFLAEKNKYDGLSPDQAKFIADRLAEAFIQKMGDVIDVNAAPGPGVMVMNIALTELKMKKKRGLLSFTPIGAVAHAATSQTEYEDMGKFAEKIKLDEANVEIELVDGGTGELLAIRILGIEGKEKGRDEDSWEGLKAEIMALADRFHTNYSRSLMNL